MIVGIDYSMSSPAVCVCSGEFKFENCKFLYITNTKKYEGTFNGAQFIGKPLYEWKDNIDRFSKLADMTREFIFYAWPDGDDISIGLEGYAMGAKGQVFNIGENTGILKYYLQYIEEWDLDIYAPSAIKKFATDKGNANKELMYEAFVKETGVDLGSIFDQSTDGKINSPISDIVDAFYIAKLQSTIN
jgi:hypothetical protein